MWTNAYEQSFQTLKERLTTTPIMSLANAHDDFDVYNDTSGIRFGCMLTKRGRVIAYASRHLKLHEQNYLTNNLELVVVMFHLCMWRHYLYGVPFQLFIDHKSLKYIVIVKDLNSR